MRQVPDVKRSVYLAGPIRGLTLKDASRWRFQAEELLHWRLDVRNPMRYMKHELPKDSILDDGTQYEGLFTSPRAIVTRDRVDCTSADVILMNLMNATQISIGTMVEIGWADALRIPIVLMMEQEGNVHEHFFTKEIPAWRVQNLSDAVRIVHSLLNMPTGK